MAVEDSEPIELDPRFQQEIVNLYRMTLYARWCIIAILWLTVGVYSLWSLRYPIELLIEHFTWAALKYGLAFDFGAAIGLFTCVGMTAGVLVGQSCNIIWGISEPDCRRFAKQVAKIRQQGNSHPLWKWVVVNSIDN